MTDTDPNYNFVEEWDTNSTIKWWNEGRTKLNVIIKAYNQWQTDGFNVEEGIRLRTQIIQGLQGFTQEDGGSGSKWGKELRGMLEFVVWRCQFGEEDTRKLDK